MRCRLSAPDSDIQQIENRFSSSPSDALFHKHTHHGVSACVSACCEHMCSQCVVLWKIPSTGRAPSSRQCPTNTPTNRPRPLLPTGEPMDYPCGASGFLGWVLLPSRAQRLSLQSQGGKRCVRPLSGERHRSEVLSLYKQIMRAAFEWPSIKKEAVVHEIRDAFRSGAGEQDPRKVHAMLAEAHAGLKELCQGVAARQRLRATPSVPKWIPRDNWRTWADDGAGSSSAESEPGRAAETWAFDELGVSPSVSMSEAKLAYHEKAKACHPDSGTPCSANDEAFKRLQKAWEHVRKHLLREQQGSRFR